MAARMQMSHRLVALAVGAAAGCAAFLLPVSAETRVCRDLEAQLAATPKSGGSAQVRKYDEAIDRQQGELRKARDMARRSKCGFAILGGNVAQCASLNATINRMEQNLLKLQGQRGRLAGGADPRRERARLLASLKTNGCRQEPEARRSPRAIDARTGREVGSSGEDDSASLRSGLDDDDRRIRTTLDPRGVHRIGELAGSFRTVCVRTCDGYYFPISYSVSSGAFMRDEQACRARCPGTEMELYFHRVPGEEPEDMISIATGQPYTDLPTAFDYRRQDYDRSQSCGCSPPKEFSVIGGETARADDVPQREDTETEPETSILALPPPRPDPAPVSDPEPASEPQDAPEKSKEQELVEENRDVRVVGPSFLPDPQEAIDLRVQDPPRDR